MVSYTAGTLRRKLSDADIVRLYLDEGLDSDTVGAAAGCSGTKVLQLVRAAGGQVRRVGGPRRVSPLKLDADEIIRRYRAGESGPQIARIADCATSSVYHVLRSNGVALRPSPIQRGRFKSDGPR
jgi:hypothetical protein